ncbi:MAG: pyridoxal phosphate-dependent aminotransferase [Actinobacteria bacterium]|jgi:aspartate/methionine/tyrosine aminotransferase|nr:pyridoxal phosphate-dependent aminotransferase [Actinomycetota bacterium]
MTTRISTRVSAVEPSPTLAVDARAKAMRQEGVDIIGFGAGEPDFPTPPHIVEAARQAASDPASHKYTPTAGLPKLRQAVASRTSITSSLDIDPSQVLITNGAKQAAFEAFATVTDPGDEVIYGTPVWSTYTEVIKLAGGVPVPVAAREDAGFHLTAADIEHAVTQRTKAILIVSPSNPTGAVLARDELRDIARLAAERGLMVVTDEIYDNLVYGGCKFSSILDADPSIADQVIIINGVSKSFAMTGWRVGWMVGPVDIIRAATNLQSQMSSNVSNVSQRAALAALDGDMQCVEDMRLAFDRRRQLAYKILSDMPGVNITEPEGAFYAFPSVKQLIGKRLGGQLATSTAQLAEIALEAAKVAVVPGEAFECPGYLRLSYAMSDDLLEIGLQRLGNLFASATAS